MENLRHLSRKILLYSFYITIKGEAKGPDETADNNIKFLIKIPKCTKSLP